eukprot:TRINITY_DN1985_c0_g1_i1.p1 TRINITY_DN1985_c0_g1~~TRINITY_DN1985_c0_g1_i1.p1  ORF type:complete len:190 (-),score=45.94 TRINITY_DN1985_c0_g1_i1:95-664(-)
MSKSVYIVHRWDGSPDRDWYSWLNKQLKEYDPSIEVHILPMPNPHLPTVPEWTAFLKEHIPPPSENIYIVGHSVGSSTVLRHIASLDDSASRYGGVLVVAGWFRLSDQFQRDAFVPWQVPYNWGNVKNHVKEGKLVSVISDNDPFTPDYVDLQKQFEANIGAKVIIAGGRKHFNEKEEPDVLNALKSLF